MKLIKLNSTLLRNFISGAVTLALIFSFSAHAEDAINNNDDGFCQTPGQVGEKSLPYTLDSASSHIEQTSELERNELRLLLQNKANGCVISKTEKQLIEQFAEINNLELKWTYVEFDWNLLPELVSNNGDIIVAQDQSLAGGIQGQVEFSLPWSNAAYKIVERSDNSRISRYEDLSGRQVAAYKGSPVWSDLLDLKESLTGMVIEEIPEGLAYEEVMRRVKTGQYDLAVADSLYLDVYLPLNPELTANFNFSDERSMTWLVQAGDNELLKQLNQYLNQQHLTLDVASIYFDDMSAIKDRGFIRIITNSNPSHYYLKNGNLYGFEYELIRDFAKKNMLRVDVVLASSQEEMFRLLQEGKGDVIAASLPGNLLTIEDSVQLTDAYNYASPVIVGRNQEDKIIDMRDLTGRRITLSHESPYWEYMLQLQEQGAEFELVKADPEINTEGVLLMVALGMYDLSVIGSHEINTGLPKKIGLNAEFVLSEPQAHHWAVRTDAQQLFNALNDYIGSEYRKENYNILHAKYFDRAFAPKPGKERLTQFVALSPYDDITRRYSEKYGFDWRLITALMFQESRFNPNAYSYAGAEGLMQLIPATAELMGVKDTSNPEASINAGIRYLDYLRSKFEESMLLEDRIWFTLASYNAGYGRVKKARELAEKMGLDKDRWFNNVEIAMLTLAKPYQHEGEEVRYCRCGQAVVYVREIRTRYFNYIRLVETQMIALHEASSRTDRLSRYN